jgi:mercuric ion transport protein
MSGQVLESADNGARTSTAVASVGLLSGAAALVGASCCVLPIVLTMAGLGGSWMVVLSGFVAWSWHILAVSGAVILAAWVLALRRPARRRVYVLLSAATLFFGTASLTVIYEIEINRYVIAMWRGS